MRQNNDTGNSWTDWLLDRFLRSIILAVLVLPYRRRVPAMGWIMRKIVAPIAGYNRRSGENIDYIYPDMVASRRREIISGVADNVGRTFIENYSTKGMTKILEKSRISGEGLAALA
jgi:KDO2-lipid IV(A) lauroyltransferase